MKHHCHGLTMQVLIIFFVVSISVVLSEDFCEANSCSTQESKCEHFNPMTFSASNQSIFLVAAQGRLGNHLIAHALSISIHKAIGVKTYLSQETHDFLTQYFEDIQLPILQNKFCNWNEINFQVFSKGIEDLVKDPALRQGHLLDLWSTGYMTDATVCCPAQEMFYFFNQNGLSSIRKNLRFKPKFKDYANDFRIRAAAKRNFPVTKITFIGVHNRRTDYIPYMQKMFRMESPYTKKFFYQAMEYFREEYEHVVFFFVSDDMEWGRKHIKNKHKDLYFLGKGDTNSPDAIGYDLALLASCNHTIITWGSFSMWASILSGGEYYSEYGVIVPGDLQYPEKKRKFRN
ncbi:galactoside 2-alpha-L-fucosyltransferase SEC1-like isoform X4 [Tigriopus californicus]|uniref:galactoside 2-alpha-L-fucosyltransferase SEC1-like isoform X4 n=1 Tax=Tigriopus californicus TaxID=6832 RepID=UPI0027DA0049|nr:galactoside 2-alpha-L-fucosyltransferase SEC1-like isoform X4 [Tigriopus californicus]